MLKVICIQQTNLHFAKEKHDFEEHIFLSESERTNINSDKANSQYTRDMNLYIVIRYEVYRMSSTQELV